MNTPTVYAPTVYAKLSLNKYSCRYSKQLYSQLALLTILVLKIYLKLTYRQISEYLEFSDRLRSYLSIKNITKIL